MQDIHDRSDWTVCALTNSPVNADGTEIKDAGRAHHHVQSDEDVTVDLAKAPFSHHLEERRSNHG